eukprot:1482920-Rhodomonas_salina.1
MAEEPGPASWFVVYGSNNQDRQEGSCPWMKEGGDSWSCSGWLQQDSLGLRWLAMLIPITYRLWMHTHLRKGQENY